MAKILKVSAPSAARRAGIKKGEELVAINGEPLSDILDYVYYEAQEKFTLTIRNSQGTERNVDIDKDEDEPLGLELDDSLEIVPRECCNHCKFCFVDQLPKGLRESLYVKDDDYRLSFSCGSFITLTNLTEKDVERIIRLKLSPLYVSVHATDEQVRLNLLGIKRAKPVMEVLKKLTDNGIYVNAQVVLCPKINDGEVLKKTLADLRSLGDKIISVAVVPVGLTSHRENTNGIRLMNAEEARAAIDTVEAFHDDERGFAYCADEMYLIAGLPVKGPEYYGSYEQIENGVGLIAKFLDEVKYALEDAPKKLSKSIAIITGVAGESTMLEAKKLLTEKWRKLKMDVFPVVNTFFGETVTVTGLVTAGDIIRTMKGKDMSIYDYVMIPSVMLKEFDTVFLDNVQLSTVEKELNHKILVSAVDGECFVDTIVYGE